MSEVKPLTVYSPAPTSKKRYSHQRRPEMILPCV